MTDVPGCGSGQTVVDGSRVGYLRAGTEGPAVVLLHGGGIDDAALSWHHTVGRLAEDYRVYAPHWPGYGTSDDEGEHSVAAYVDLLDGFLDRIGVDGAHLVGLSMGGAAALGYTIEAPDSVESLCLTASYGLGCSVTAGSLWFALSHTPGANTLGWNTLGLTRMTTRAGLSNVVYDASTLDDDFVTGIYERAREAGAGSAFAAFQRNEVTADGGVATDFREHLPDVETRTLLVHGRHDPVFPTKWSESAHDALPNSRLEVFDHCGHWVPRELPEKFNATLREFLDRPDGDAR